MFLKPDKPSGPSLNTAHTLFDSLLRLVCKRGNMPIPSYILPVGRFARCRQNQYCSGVEERTGSCIGPAIPILCRAGRQVEYQFREKKEGVIEASA